MTALQPGPTDTDFFHRAGMDDTEVGRRASLKASRYDVARQGIDALMAGKDHVYAASLKTKLEGDARQCRSWKCQRRDARKDG